MVEPSDYVIVDGKIVLETNSKRSNAIKCYLFSTIKTKPLHLFYAHKIILSDFDQVYIQFLGEESIEMYAKDAFNFYKGNEDFIENVYIFVPLGFDIYES